jgi:hypothetical protein
MFAAAACVTLLALAAAACESSDPVAPADSILTVSANPQTVLVPRGGGVASADITATLRSKNGTRLPDQEVTFSTTAGDLDPIADTPILTNSDGQAKSTLRTNQAATVTARSGGISGTTQILTTPSIVSQVLLNVENQDPPFDQALHTCADKLDLTATVRDPNSKPVIGVTVVFSQTGNLNGSFTSSQGSTDPNGEVLTTWNAGSNCTALCVGAGDPNVPCTLTLTATSGGMTSFPVSVADNIP